MSKSTHWSLDALYTGYQDPHFQNDVQALKELSSRLPSFCEDLQKAGRDPGSLLSIKDVHTADVKRRCQQYR